jgi:hypothetical protein
MSKGFQWRGQVTFPADSEEGYNSEQGLKMSKPLLRIRIDILEKRKYKAMA